jgi:hypothetical protein
LLHSTFCSHADLTCRVLADNLDWHTVVWLNIEPLGSVMWGRNKIAERSQVFPP